MPVRSLYPLRGDYTDRRVAAYSLKLHCVSLHLPAIHFARLLSCRSLSAARIDHRPSRDVIVADREAVDQPSDQLVSSYVSKASTMSLILTRQAWSKSSGFRGELTKIVL